MNRVQRGTNSNEVLLRFANGSKFALKEKFVQIYEMFFKGNDPSVNKPNFWDELFLLKVNAGFLTNCVAAVNEEQLMALRPVINTIVMHCIVTLQDENPVRVTHAIETLSILLTGIFKKKFASVGIEVVNLLTGMDKAGALFKAMIESMENLLKSPTTTLKVRGHVLGLIFVIQNGLENINLNTLFEYFMITNLFEALVKVILDPDTKPLAPDALVILMVFCNYSKYEKKNPYLAQLAEISDRATIMMFAAVISDIFKQNLKIIREEIAEENSGLVSQLYNWWYSTPPVEQLLDMTPKYRLGSAFLGLYELVYSNQDFARMILVSVSESDPHKGQAPLRKSSSAASFGSHESGGEPQVAASLGFCRFLTIASHFLDDVRDARCASLGKLVFLTLLCLLENKETAYYIYDKNLRASVQLHQSKLPHLEIDEQPRGLIEVIFDILSLYLNHNLRKHFQFDLYHLCLDIALRALFHLRMSQVKAKINFGHLWKGVVSLTSFLVQNAQHFHPTEIFPLAEKVINVFNIALLYGDAIFLDEHSHNTVFYEIIRNYDLLENLNNIAVGGSEGGDVGSSRRVTSLSLVNIRAVHSHMQFKIEAWQKLNGNSSLSPEQVLSLIHQNIESLELKKVEKLELFDRYSEHPQHTAFFRTYLRAVITDTRKLQERLLGASEPVHPPPQ